MATSSDKNIFEAEIFAPGIFACGIFRGSGLDIEISYKVVAADAFVPGSRAPQSHGHIAAQDAHIPGQD